MLGSSLKLVVCGLMYARETIEGKPIVTGTWPKKCKHHVNTTGASIGDGHIVGAWESNKLNGTSIGRA